MRVVLDTNVVVSAAFFGGSPRRVVEARISGRIQVVSPVNLRRNQRVCQRLGASYPGTDHQPLLTAFLAHGLLVADSTDEGTITADPDDDKFMRCGLAAGATVVSGDRDLLDADGWRGVRVATPAELLLNPGKGSRYAR